MAYATITRAGSGKSDHSTDTTTFTAALSGVLPGDVIDFTVTTTSSTATTLTPVNSTGALFPSGVGTGDNVQSQGWYFVVGSSVPTNLVVNLAAARQGTLAWIAYRGVDNTTPLDVAVSAGAQDPAQTTTPAMPSITTVTPGAMIAGGLCHGSGSTTVTSFPSGWSLVVDGTRRNGMIFEKGIQASAGATGTATFTLSGTQQNRMWIVAHRPAVVADPLEATLTTETYPGFTDDVADGAAIVYDSSDPSSSVVITTNKATGGGLYVLDLDGQIMSSNLDGAANSVDWRDLTGVSGWDNRLLVMTCDREDNLLRYYWMNRTTKALTSAGTYSLGWEPYGTCLYVHSTGQVYAFVTQRGSDDVSPRNMYQFPLSRSSETVSTGSVARTIALASVVEGLAADDTTGYLFASEEDVGLFRYSASPSGGSSRTTVDTAGGGNLVADVEDVAIARSPAGAWLLVSSQGDSTYHVYDLATLAHEQSFTVVRPGGSDTVTSTDGLDVYLGNFGGSFPDGLIVVHDGDKTPISDFAFVDAGLVFGDLPADPPGEGGGAASFGYSVAGTGSTTRTGGGAAAYALATAGSGAAALSGGGSAAYALGVTGTGTATHSGAGSTGYALTTDGTGSAPAVGAASGGGATGYDLAVTGTGSAPAVGSAGGGGSVGYTVTVTGTGTMQPGGGGTAAYALTAVGTGGTVKGGGGSVGYLYVGTGTGSAPIPGVSAGGGETGYALATIGTGSTTRSGSGSTGLALTVAGTGTATRTGGGTVAIAYAVTGTGINPDTLIPVWPATIHLRVVDTTIGLRADDDTITLKETP